MLLFEPTLTEQQQQRGQQNYIEHIPRGRLWEAYGVKGTSDYALSAGIGAMYAIVESYTEYLKKELNPLTTEDMIIEWEESCGLPDPCMLINNLSLDERRKQVVARLAKKPIVTNADFERMIKALTGYDAIVLPRTDPKNFLNAVWGDYDAGSLYDGFIAPFNRFIFDVFVNVKNVIGYDDNGRYDLLDLYDGYAKPSAVECVINNIKPANSLAFFYYSNSFYDRVK
jgi:uncharacterized protein YmfQ (DUF2313 family)